jgi:hypothetical protein
MAAGAAGASAGAAAAAAISEAIKASGSIVRVEARDFEALVASAPDPLVLHQEPSGMFSRHHRYATHYRGFTFVAQDREPLFMPAGAQVIRARKIWFPD